MSHFTRKLISTQSYAKIVKKWMKSLGFEDVSPYSTHSILKFKLTLIYNKTKNVDAIRRLLGQSSVTATSTYLEHLMSQVMTLQEQSIFKTENV